MRKILVFALVALMAAPLIATAAPKLKMGVTIEDFNDVFMRYALDQLTAEVTAESGGIVCVVRAIATTRQGDCVAVVGQRCSRDELL